MFLLQDRHEIIGEIGHSTAHAIQLVIRQRAKIIELRIGISIQFARLHHCHCSC
jgi:hypothetical protein